MSNILVVGSLNMDLVIQVPNIPKPGETILGSDFRTYPGGKGANQAVAAARLGASVSMVGQVGDDAYGKELIRTLVKEGVNVDSIFIDKKNPTGVALISVGANGQNSIAVASGANFSLTKDQIQIAWERMGEVDILIMPLETPLETIIEAAKIAKTRDVKVILNPAPARKLGKNLLSFIDVLVPNEQEIFQIIENFGTNAPIEKIAHTLLSKGVSVVVTTLGSNGALIIDEKNPKGRCLSPFSVHVKDTTAAGDSFVAALGVGLATGKTLEESCFFANGAGALTVTKNGAQPSLPTLAELNRFLEIQKEK